MRRLHAARSGLRRGWIEFRHTITNPEDLTGYVMYPVAAALFLVWLSGRELEEVGLSVATFVMPATFALLIALTGVTATAGYLAVDREDGTLLRAKAVPNGMAGYLVAKSVLLVLGTVLTLALVLIPPLLMLDGFALSPTALLHIAAIAVLGLTATVPFGAIIGSVFTGARQVAAITMLPLIALVTVSGIFFPITQLPEWAQGPAQLSPVYWLGLGFRAAFLPEAAVALEVGESWRHLETVGALAAWTAVGMLIAPFVLRKMAERESGGVLEERRRRASQRI